MLRDSGIRAPPEKSDGFEELDTRPRLSCQNVARPPYIVHAHFGLTGKQDDATTLGWVLTKQQFALLGIGQK
ncbi:hypothetical protein E5D57_010317 [Metarhizium anisopliae]|nr:hypothetical protein E5D57_010317 [Metarhizium anisopliae]